MGPGAEVKTGLIPEDTALDASTHDRQKLRRLLQSDSVRLWLFATPGMQATAPMNYPNLMATVGGTPLVELGRIATHLPGRIFAKLEMRNPCGSVKDRVGVGAD